MKSTKYSIITEIMLIASKTDASHKEDASQRISNILSLLLIENNNGKKPKTQDLYISGILDYLLTMDNRSLKAEIIMQNNRDDFRIYGMEDKWVRDSFQKGINRFNKLISSNETIFRFTRKERNKYNILVISKVLNSWLTILKVFQQVRLGITNRRTEIDLIEKRLVSVLAYVLLNKKTKFAYINQEIEYMLSEKIKINWIDKVEQSYLLKEVIKTLKNKDLEIFIENKGIKSSKDRLANFGIKISEIINKGDFLEIIEKTKSYLSSNIDFESNETIDAANELIRKYESNLEKVGEKIDEIGIKNFIWFITYYIVLLAMFIVDRVEEYEIDIHQIIHAIQGVRIALIDEQTEYLNIEFVLYYYYAELMKSVALVENIVDEPYVEAMEYFTLAYFLKDRVTDANIEEIDINYIFHDLISDYHLIKLLLIENITNEVDDQKELSELELHYVYQAMIELEYHLECAVYYEDELSEKYTKYLRLTLEILLENNYNEDKSLYESKLEKYFDI